MSSGIPDLWPDDVAVADVLPPVLIMRHQAGQLRARTKNVLEAEVKTSGYAQRGRLKHEFYIIAPALNRYRYLLFAAEHDAEMPYPVTVTGEGVVQDWPAASTQEEFVGMVSRVLQSTNTKAAIQSLIARSNEEGFQS